MSNPIHKLHTSLNMFKGFETAYSSNNSEVMLIKIEGKVYRVKIVDTGEKELSPIVMKKYLR